MVLKRGRIAKQYQQQFQQVACQAKRATRDGVQALAPGTSPTSRAMACRTQNQGRGRSGKKGSLQSSGAGPPQICYKL